MTDEKEPLENQGSEVPLTASSSLEILYRAQAGDHDARERIFARYVPRLTRWASGRLPAGARKLLDTDDIIQETMVRTVDKLAGFEIRGEGAFMAYLRQAALNRIRDEARRLSRRPAPESLDEEVADEGRSPLEEAIGRGVIRSYETALSRLREEEQQAVVARIEMGFDYNEIAAALGKPSADAARMAVSRALVRLAREMDHEDRS